MRALLLVLTFAWMLLVAVPALAQPSHDGASAAGAQYDQAVDPGSTIGDRALHDAITASGAIRAASEDSQGTEGNAVSAATLPSASSELAAASAWGGNTETGAQGESASVAEEQDEGANTAEEQGESASAAEEQGESASTAEEQGEGVNTADFKKLPETGGPSPLWLGVPLACVGGLFARRLFST